jgi:hypothetical protein
MNVNRSCNGMAVILYIYFNFSKFSTIDMFMCNQKNYLKTYMLSIFL